MPTKKVTTKIKIGGKVKITPGTAKEDWSDFPQPPVTRFNNPPLNKPMVSKEIANISNFQDNPFAKKYKNDLLRNALVEDALHPNEKYSYGADWADEDAVDSTVYAWENAKQVKSWSRHERAGVYSKIYLALAFLMAFASGFWFSVFLTNL